MSDTLVTVTLRTEIPADEEFVRELMTDAISRELCAENWPDTLRDSMLPLQYQIRRNGLRGAFPGALSRIILASGEPAGWMVSAQLEEEVRLAQIAIRRDLQRRGIGTAAIRLMIAEAAMAGKPLRLNVASSNAGAIRLYLHLGFHRIHGGDEMNYLMEYAGG